MERIPKIFIFFSLFIICPTSASLQTLEKGKGSNARIITRKASDTPEHPYDAGTVRFLALSEETGGRWSMFEVKEMPGYKTAWHRHNERDEAFFILEGILTMKI